MKNVCGCYSTGWHCYSCCCCCCCWSGGRRRGLRRIKPLMRQIIWSSPITSHLYVWCVFVSIAQIILKDFRSNVARRWYKCNCPAAFSSGIIKASCNVICCNVQCNDGIEGPLRFGLIQALWLEETVLFICHKKKRKLLMDQSGAFVATKAELLLAYFAVVYFELHVKCYSHK